MHAWNPSLFMFFSTVLVFIVIITLCLRGDQAVYFSILTWFFYPNWAINIMGVGGVPLFSFVQIFQSLALILIMIKAIIMKEFPPAKKSSIEFKLIIFFLIVVVFQTVIGNFFIALIYNRYDSIAPGIYVYNTVIQYASIVYLFACYYFIYNERQIEIIFKIIFICGLILAIEYFLVMKVSVVGGIFGKYSLNPDGKRFQSIFLNDLAGAPLWAGLAALCGFYFYLVYRKIRNLILSIIMVLVPFYSVIRSVLLGLILTSAFYFLCFMNLRKIKTWVILLLVISAITLSLQLNIKAYFMSRMASQALARRMRDVGSKASFQERIGQTIRGLQVWQNVFPLGLGEDMEQYYMPLSPPVFLSSYHLPILEAYPEIYRGYQRVTSGEIIAEIQIGYVSCIVAYGFLGILLLCFVIGILLNNLIHLFMRLSKESRRRKLLISLIGLFLVYFSFLVFNTSPLIYVIFYFLYHVTFVLRNLEENNLVKFPQVMSAHGMVFLEEEKEKGHYQ